MLIKRIVGGVLHACSQIEWISVEHWIAWVNIILPFRSTCVALRRAHLRLLKLTSLGHLLLRARLHALRGLVVFARVWALPVVELWGVRAM